MSTCDPLPAFSAVGIELEYMIADARTLDVRPIADRVLESLAGRGASEVVRDGLGWSNELVAHVIELKNVAPSPTLEPLAARFEREVGAMNRTLESLGACLMPTGMHPWMDPTRETRLWPHDEAAIYRTFDRVFDCRRHGWANLQSMHINLPFAGDDEFGRLHAAIRVALPLIPALAASSPIADGAAKRALDYRLDVYRSNAGRVASIVGDVVPEPVASRADYEATILAPMYRQIAPLDPNRVLQHEWLNARGAIARFDRSAIEIRVADTQECPRADIAVAAAVVALVRALHEERLSVRAAQSAIPTRALATILEACVDDAERARIDDAAFLDAVGMPPAPCEAGEIWAKLIDDSTFDPATAQALTTIAGRGPLARRIVDALGSALTRERLRRVYGELCDCLARGELFRAR